MGTGMGMVVGNSRGTVVCLLKLWMLTAGAGFWAAGSAGTAALAQTVVARQPVFIQDRVSGSIVWIERRPVLQPENQVGLLAAEKLLATTELAKELELSQRQQQELAAWLKKAERESTRLFFEAYAGDREPAEVEELGQVLRANLGEELQEILLPPQRRRLAEVEQRIALRLMGWERYWQTFAGQQALSLSADEQQALREQQGKWGGRVTARAAKIARRPAGSDLPAADCRATRAITGKAGPVAIGSPGSGLGIGADSHGLGLPNSDGTVRGAVRSDAARGTDVSVTARRSICRHANGRAKLRDPLGLASSAAGVVAGAVGGHRIVAGGASGLPG